MLLGRAVPEEASRPFAAVADTLQMARRAEPAVWGSDALKPEAELITQRDVGSGPRGLIAWNTGAQRPHSCRYTTI